MIPKTGSVFEGDHGPGIITSNACHADRGVAGTDEAELAGGALRQVEHATPDERAAIVDAHDDAAAIVLVGDPQFGAERQRAVGGGQRRRVHALARCGARVQRVPGSTATLAGGGCRSGRSADHQASSDRYRDKRGLV